MMQNALFMIGTPIGNLQDMTQRARDVLSLVDCLLCEDTRVTARLLRHYEIHVKQLYSCNSHNERQRAALAIDILAGGGSVAYTSDAGTPGISDPGNLLVQTVRAAGYPVVAVCGASALSAIISVCGFDLSRGFYFSGFLPRTPTKLHKLLDQYEVLFAFESPYRIRKSLTLIAQHKPESHICLCRELTKLHEQTLYGTAAELAEQPFREKGEFTLAINRN